MTARCPWSDLPRRTCSCEPCHEYRTAELDLDERAAAIRRVIADGTLIQRRQPMRVVHAIAHQPPTTSDPSGRQLAEDTSTWELTDYITALTDNTRHAQPFQTPRHNPDGTVTFITQRHYTTSPPLLEQLWSAAEQSGSTEGGRRAFGSKPSARLDALDVAMRIENEVHRLLRDCRVTDSHDKYPHTIDAVRHLGSLATHDRDVFRTVRSWWSAARVVTGWDSPAWAPNSSCPLCAARGGLRIKLDLHTAVCVECHETWMPETIGLLADHIRAEADESDESCEIVPDAG